MNITVTEKSISSIYNDKLFKAELTEYLNEAIDTELEKGDDMDTDLIDECINVLDKLQSEENITPALRLLLTEKQVLKYCRKDAGTANKNHAKAAVAACLIVILSGAALLNANPAFAQQAKDLFSNIISALGIAAEQSETNENSEISSIYAIFPADETFSAKRERDIDLSGITIKAVYENGSEKTIPLKKCTVTKTEKFDGNNNSILVVVAYEGCAFSVIYTIEG